MPFLLRGMSLSEGLQEIHTWKRLEVHHPFLGLLVGEYVEKFLFWLTLAGDTPRISRFEARFKGERKRESVLSFSWKDFEAHSWLLEPFGTPFQQRVWKETFALGPGDHKTYGQIAQEVGCPRGARAVGAALGANPIVPLIPCHRVYAHKAIGGYAWGQEKKEGLLAWEAHEARSKTV